MDFVPRLNSTYSYWIYFPYLSVLSLIKKFLEVPLCRVELEVSQLCWSEEKLNHVLKIDGDKLFKYLLTNKVFSRQILSWNFKMKFCLNRAGRLVWQFLGWKLIVNSNSLFCKIKIRLILLKFWAQTRQQCESKMAK